MNIDYSKMNDIEHYGDKKIVILKMLSDYYGEVYEPNSRPDFIVRKLAGMFLVEIDFHMTRKFAKRLLKKFVCCDQMNSIGFSKLLRIERSSPNHFEMESLKKRISNDEYKELTTTSPINIPHEGLVTIGLSKNFYQSKEWKQVRYQALRVYKNFCQCCGRKRSEDIWLEVDHIKPRSLAPELALDISNLQILCMDCNQGKSNLDCTDWRD